MPGNNIWLDWLEETPQAAWGALRPQQGPISFLDFWRGQEGNLWGEYQGALGKMALAGQPPSLGFTNFLQGFPWLQRYWALSPQQRGYDESRYAPRLRWNV